MLKAGAFKNKHHCSQATSSQDKIKVFCNIPKRNPTLEHFRLLKMILPSALIELVPALVV